MFCRPTPKPGFDVDDDGHPIFTSRRRPNQTRAVLQVAQNRSTVKVPGFSTQLFQRMVEHRPWLIGVNHSSNHRAEWNFALGLNAHSLVIERKKGRLRYSNNLTVTVDNELLLQASPQDLDFWEHGEHRKLDDGEFKFCFELKGSLDFLLNVWATNRDGMVIGNKPRDIDWRSMVSTKIEVCITNISNLPQAAIRSIPAFQDVRCPKPRSLQDIVTDLFNCNCRPPCTVEEERMPRNSDLQNYTVAGMPP